MWPDSTLLFLLHYFPPTFPPPTSESRMRSWIVSAELRHMMWVKLSPAVLTHRFWWPHLLWRSLSVLKAGSCAESARLLTLPLPHWLSVSCCMYVPQKKLQMHGQPWCMLADHMTQSQLTSVSVIQRLPDARTGVQGYSLISLTVTWWWTQHS